MPLQGMDQLRAQIGTYAKHARGALGAALYQEALAVVPGAIRDCPWEFKFLRNSAYVTLPDTSAAKLQSSIGFSRWYGLFVEERDDLHHPHGKAHFLRDNFTARMPGFLQRLAARTRQNIADGVVVAQPGNVPTVPPDGGHPGDERGLAARLPGLARKLRDTAKNRRYLDAAKKWDASRRVAGGKVKPRGGR